MSSEEFILQDMFVKQAKRNCCEFDLKCLIQTTLENTLNKHFLMWIKPVIWCVMCYSKTSVITDLLWKSRTTCSHWSPPRSPGYRWGWRIRCGPDHPQLHTTSADPQLPFSLLYLLGINHLGLSMSEWTYNAAYRGSLPIFGTPSTHCTTETILKKKKSRDYTTNCWNYQNSITFLDVLWVP